MRVWGVAFGSPPIFASMFDWRGVRAAEGARLESVYGVKLIEGSNPSLSAKRSFFDVPMGPVAPCQKPL